MSDLIKCLYTLYIYILTAYIAILQYIIIDVNQNINMFVEFVVGATQTRGFTLFFFILLWECVGRGGGALSLSL